MQEIQQTGVLKVGIRKDAVLFGYEDGQGWKGYCTTFADALANRLSRQLNRNVNVVAVRSTIQNREAIVRNPTLKSGGFWEVRLVPSGARRKPEPYQRQD